MEIKTYLGDTLEQCFAQIKYDLGDDAVIVRSRIVRPILNRFGRPRHEVVASSDMPLPQVIEAATRNGRILKEAATARRSRNSEGAGTAVIERPVVATYQPYAQPAVRFSRGESLPDHGVSNAGSVPLATAEIDLRLQRFEEQLSTISTSIEKLSYMNTLLDRRQPRRSKAAPAKSELSESLPGALNLADFDMQPKQAYPEILAMLSACEVAPTVARRLIDELPEDLSVPEAASRIRTRIAQGMLIAPGLGERGLTTQIAAFLGATGVGKTTTLTKIAAKLSIVEGFKVGVITLDTHRVAATRQLETYGEILRLPVKVAYSGEELVHLCAEFTDEGYDFVLIDTAGKSPNDALPLAEVAQSLSQIGDVTRYLTIPATMSRANLEHMVERFYKLLSPDAIIITKVDEAVNPAHYGHLMNLQAQYGLPLAYLTNGQRVPDDIASPNVHLIADRIVGQTAGVA